MKMSSKQQFKTVIFTMMLAVSLLFMSGCHIPLYAASAGDVDGNGRVELQDAQVILKIALNIIMPDEGMKELADLTGDGKVDLTDAKEVLRKALGITGSETDNISKYAAQVLQLVNSERSSQGLSMLSTTTSLAAAANKRAEETVRLFSHTRPDGRSCFTVLEEYGISYQSAGENIAYGQKTPQEVVNAWMNSSGHRANILNAGYSHVGIGVYQADNGTIYWSQLFTN